MQYAVMPSYYLGCMRKLITLQYDYHASPQNYESPKWNLYSVTIYIVMQSRRTY